MFKRAVRYAYFVAIYLSGIVIGGIYTPDVISYAKEMNAQRNLEQQDTEQKPQQPKKTLNKSRQLG